MFDDDHVSPSRTGILCEYDHAVGRCKYRFAAVRVAACRLVPILAEVPILTEVLGVIPVVPDIVLFSDVLLLSDRIGEAASGKLQEERRNLFCRAGRRRASDRDDHHSCDAMSKSAHLVLR